MGLTMKEKKSVTREITKAYQKASKKEKKGILDEFVRLTGYNRCYASAMLKNYGKKTRISSQVVLMSDPSLKAKRNYTKTYGDKVKLVLITIWFILDCICGKRMKPVLGEVIDRLQHHGEIELDEDTHQKLLRISASTIDRLLREERKKLTLKGRSLTKPGTLLKNQIPIRTFSEWDEGRPGFVEVDLVGHDGGNGRGEFAQTLDVTDICTGWTETQAVRNKAQKWVFEALTDIRRRLPFQLLGIDSDNGGEFINHHLVGYCKEQKLTFTRSRSYRKNDGCYVEQKNYSVVRRAVGYLRYDTEQELKVLNELYPFVRLHTNFFLPSMKLLQKTRIGSKVFKKHDEPKTPYQRVLDSPQISKEDKEKLKKIYSSLNPAALKRKITRLQQKLFQIAKRKNTKQRNAA